MEYAILDKKLIWEYDEAESNATTLNENNLFIEGTWNMKDTVGYDDICVAASILSDDSFRFITYCGLSFTMRLVGDNVECIQKQITK